MNSALTTNEDEIRRALDDIARNFHTQNSERFAPLIPYRNQIRDLRSQNASFRTIARLLKQFAVKTTGETVRRFYHVVIEQKPKRRSRIRRRDEVQIKKRLRKRRMPMPLSPQSDAKPRIARIEEL